MAAGYSWSASRSGGAFRLPGADHLGWWAAAAMIASLLLHVMVFFALDRMKIAFKFEEARELSTRPTDLRQMEVQPFAPERALPPEEVIQPPSDSSALLDEIELLDLLPKDEEIDISPEIVEASYAIQLNNPAREGDPAAAALEVSAGFEIEADLPELGRQAESIRPAEIGQVTVDPGAVQPDDLDLGKFTEDLIRQGANGKVDQGTMEGMVSLDSMLSLPSKALLGAKTMLPSDLLFEFNRAELRESAKVNLMKLGLLMDRNPGLFCWIEGHTDLVGGDEFNLELSRKRADSVRDYLVKSLRMDPAKIITRGFGRYQPLVTSGSADEQAANRRVEVRMRKNPPSESQLEVAPKKAAVIEETPSPKAVLVKPLRHYPPVDEAPPQRAAPVEEAALPGEVLRATPVEPEIPRAIPRAEIVE
jgi:OOP family OmpA-OmpF porin